MKRLFCICSFLVVIFFSCNKDECKNRLCLDPQLSNEVEVRYEVTMDQPNLFDLFINYTNGEAYFNFDKQQYENRDSIKREYNLSTDSWVYEGLMRKGSILYVGANVMSKENTSASVPATITLKIYVNDIMVANEKELIHASCEYIYGAKVQDEKYYIYIH